MNELASHEVPDAVESEEWSLVVDGSVARRRDFSHENLRSMGLVEATDDFSCVEGWTATDLSWRGVRVTDLLERVRPHADVDFALVHAMDGDYACGFPLGRLDGALLALELNGEALPIEDGGPARLVPPMAESDCWESVKWVDHIELHADEPDETARDIALSGIE